MLKEKQYSGLPAKFFLITGLLIGVLYAVFVPYGSGFDEERHLARIYYMSLGEFMPNFSQPRIQEEVFDLSYQRRYVQSPAFDMYSAESLSRKFSRLEEDIRYGYRTPSMYSPVIFFPQAMIGRALWWKFNFPILPTIMLERIAGVLLYVLSAYAAIRILPFGKWVFAALALAPAALYQAATLNADGFTTAASFLFIAFTLSVYVNEADGVKKRSVWILFLLMLWLGVAKPGAIILLPLLLVLVKHPFHARKWVFLLLAGVVAAVVLNIGWWLFVTDGAAFSGNGAQSVSSERGLFSPETFKFIGIIFKSLALTFSSQIQGWIANYGFGAGKVPPLVYLFWLLFVLLAWGLERAKVDLPVWIRVFLVGVFFISSLGIYTAAFLPNYATGGITSLAKHGRYYISLAPMFFLGLSGIFVFRQSIQKLLTNSAIAFFFLAHIYYSIGIYTTYYTYCNYDAYAGNKCTLPIYKNIEKEDASSINLRDGVNVSQTFTKFCGNLESVEVFIKSTSDVDDGKLSFTLLDENQKELSQYDVRIQDIVENTYLQLPVSVPYDEGHNEYEIQISSFGVLGDGIELALAPADFYPGYFSVNGESMSQDLLIHYVCTTP